MDLVQLLEKLESTFSYRIERQINSYGYTVQIWDGYGLRRAYVQEGTLEKAIEKALDQYKNLSYV